MHYRAKASGFWQRCACERSPANSPAENLHAAEFIQGVHSKTCANVPHARHPSGAADLIASRIPPGHIVWWLGCGVVGLLGCGVSNTNSNNSNTTKSTPTPTPSTPPTTHQQHHEHQQHQQSKEDKRTPKTRKKIQN